MRFSVGQVANLRDCQSRFAKRVTNPLQVINLPHIPN